MWVTIKNQRVLFSKSNCYYALSNIEKAVFFSSFKTPSPSREETCFEMRVLMSAADGWRFVDFGVATVNLKFLNSGCFFEFGDIKSLHF